MGRRPVPPRRTRAWPTRKPNRGKSAFGVFHDIALVDNREALALVSHGILEGRANETLRARLADRFDAYANLVGCLLGKPDLLQRCGQFPLHELQDLLRLRAASLVVYARIDVFRVLAEDDHVHLLRVLHGEGTP